MGRKDELNKLIDGGDESALLEVIHSRSDGNKLLRRILARLYSTDPQEKWKAVTALQVVAGEGGMSSKKVEGLIQRFLWAMSDESGAVPYGIPEALAAVLGPRPELIPRYLPLLVSYLVHDELVQTGPILAGVIWALGQLGIESSEELDRALPGLRAALQSKDQELQGAALFALPRLALVDGSREEIRALAEVDGHHATLLIDGRIETLSIAELAERCLA